MSCTQYRPFIGFYPLSKLCLFLGIDNIYELRLARLVAETFATLAFAHYFGKIVVAIKGVKKWYWLSIIIALTGTLLTPQARSLGYTELSNTFGVLSATYILFLVYHHFIQRQHSFRVLSGAVIFGALCGYLIFVKPSVPFLMLVLLSFVLLQFRNRIDFLKIYSTSLCSLLLFFLLYITDYGGISAWWNDFQISLKILEMLDYTVLSKLGFYFIVDGLPLLFCILIIFFFYRSRSLVEYRVHFFLLLTSAIFLLTLFYHNDTHITCGDLLYFALVPFIVIFLFRKNIGKRIAKILKLNAGIEQLVITICLFTPFIIILGTEGQLLFTFQAHLPLLFLALLLLVLSEDSIIHPIGVKGLLIVLLIFSLSLSVKNQIVSPFGLNGTIFEHNVKIDFLAEQFYGTPEDYKFWSELKTTVYKYGFEKGDPLISFGVNSGVSYLLEGTMPYNFSYLWYEHITDPFEYFLKNIYSDPVKMPMLIVPNSKNPYLYDIFNSVEEMKFDRYQKVATVYTPYQNSDDYYITYDSLRVYSYQPE